VVRPGGTQSIIHIPLFSHITKISEYNIFFREHVIPHGRAYASTPIGFGRPGSSPLARSSMALVAEPKC
jgi:hypothetical protein